VVVAAVNDAGVVVAGYCTLRSLVVVVVAVAVVVEIDVPLPPTALLYTSTQARHLHYYCIFIYFGRPLEFFSFFFGMFLYSSVSITFVWVRYSTSNLTT